MGLSGIGKAVSDVRLYETVCGVLTASFCVVKTLVKEFKGKRGNARLNRVFLNMYEYNTWRFTGTNTIKNGGPSRGIGGFCGPAEHVLGIYIRDGHTIKKLILIDNN